MKQDEQEHTSLLKNHASQEAYQNENIYTV